MEGLASDFVTICIQTLPDIAGALEQAGQLGFKNIPEGTIPEWNEVVNFDEGWSLWGKAVEETTIIVLRLAEQQLDGQSAEILAASSASLCEMNVVGPAADADTFETSLSDLIRLGRPALDIVNSGRREKSWNVYVAYNRSTMALKRYDSQTATGFSVSIVVPHQIQ